MKRNVFSILYFAVCAIGLAISEPKEQHFFGTPVFIDLGDDYSYSSNIAFSYIKKDLSIAFFCTRVPDSVDRVRFQFESSGGLPETLPRSARTIYVQRSGGVGAGSIQYLLPIGDKNESAIVSATILVADNVNIRAEEIKSLLETVSWRPDRGLDFEGAYFFSPTDFGELKPTAIIGNRIVFTVGGTTIVHAPFQLSIGKNIVRADVEQYLGELEEYFIGAETNGGVIDRQERKTVLIDGVPGVEFNLTYTDDDGEHRKLFCYFISGTLLYFIVGDSIDREYDKYLDHFDSIVSAFKVK